jgi:hypothetical protein
MTKIGVMYESGSGRHTSESVDWMLAEVDGIELYAELVNDTWDETTESFADETATYDVLKAEIIEQAKSAGIDESRLKFRYDD